MALCVGTPEFAGTYFEALERTPDPEGIDRLKVAFKQRLQAANAPSETQMRLVSLFDVYGQVAGPEAVELLHATAEVARKFTFASPEAVELDASAPFAAPVADE